MYLASINHRKTDEFVTLQELADFAPTRPAEACTDVGADMPSRPRASWLDTASAGSLLVCSVLLVVSVALYVALPWGEVFA